MPPRILPVRIAPEAPFYAWREPAQSAHERAAHWNPSEITRAVGSCRGVPAHANRPTKPAHFATATPARFAVVVRSLGATVLPLSASFPPRPSFGRTPPPDTGENATPVVRGLTCRTAMLHGAAGVLDVCPHPAMPCTRSSPAAST
jgi:hypothetical protein